MNIALICSCLPILPLLFRRKARGLPKSSGRSSTYYRLRNLGPSSGASGNQDAGIDQEQGQEARRRLDTVIQHDDIGSIIDAVSHSRALHTVADHTDKPRSSWHGDGILKTVDVEQTGIKVPGAVVVAP